MNLNTTLHNDFAQTWGSPGARARVRGIIRLVWPLLIMLAVGGYLVRATLPVPMLEQPVAAGLLALIAFTLAIQLQRSHALLAAYMKGARGEEMVAHLLGFLPATFCLFHGGDLRASSDLPDYDHVVIGPTGLFVVETKNWTGHIAIKEGHIRYNGSEPTRPPVEQVQQIANRLRHILEHADPLLSHVEITPVLCFAGSIPEGGIQGLQGVMLCHATELNHLILSCDDEPLTPDAITAASSALARYYTSGPQHG